MNLEQFIEVLDGAGLEFHAEDILDAIWLAGRDRTLTLHPPRPAPEPGTIDPGRPPIELPKKEPPQEGGGETIVADPAPPPLERQAAPIYPRGTPSSADRTVRASPVAVPAGRALANRLGLMRSLRPLRQRWPSRRDLELDEEHTVEATAELRSERFQSIFPVFQPRWERWFDVDLVCEDDAAIELWDQAIRDFSQMLRDTGAFRQVRSWRLRLPPFSSARPAAPRSAILETPTGGQVPTRALAGRGTRRLIFFATHGASRHWLDGRYARVLEPWVHDCSVVLLHLMPRDRWQHTPLGDPHGSCAAEQPGSSTSILKVEPLWWALSFDPESKLLLPIPATPLNAAAMSEWAHMQMARGRHCPVFLIDPRAPALDEERLDLPSMRDTERTIAHLRETSPEAFRLAVYLCANPFTIPVARLIHDAMFGAAADQSHLAELFLSGLVVAKSPNGGESHETNALYFDLRPQASAVFMRSLREADAERIAQELWKRVSQHIEDISGSPYTFEGLVPDEHGKYDLPVWAQPFAEMAVALGGLPQTGDNTLGLFHRFKTTYPPEIVGAGARLAAEAKPLRPDSVAADVWDALVRAHLVRPTADGEWVFPPGIAERLKRLDEDTPLAARVLSSLDLARACLLALLRARITTIGQSDVRSRAETARQEREGRTVRALCLLSDGRLASGSWDTTIRLWDVATGTETARLEGHSGIVWALCLLPDGRLASGSWDTTIRLWDVATGAEIARLQGSESDRDWVGALCALPDGRLASGFWDTTIRLWDIATGAETARLEGHSGIVWALCVLPDGRLASGSNDATIRLWDVSRGSGGETARLDGHSGSLRTLCVLPDGQLASGSRDRTIRLWDVATGAETARLEGHSGEVWALCVLPDGRLASGSQDRTIRLWDVGAKREVARFQTDDPLTCLAVLPDGRLVAGGQRGRLHWLEIESALPTAETKNTAEDTAREDSAAEGSDFASAAQRKRIAEVLISAGMARERADERLRHHPNNARELALEALATTRSPDAAFRLHLRIIEVFAGSIVAQIILRRGEQLEVAADILAPGTAPGYAIANWEGVIGLAATRGQFIWVSDVATHRRYIPAEPMTKSELALPLFDQRETSAVSGVVNIEMPERGALSAEQIEWLRAFVAPLASRIPTRYPRTFISVAPGAEASAQTDAAFAQRLDHDLRSSGIYADPIPSPEDLNVGDAILVVFSVPPSAVDINFMASQMKAFEAFQNVVLVVTAGPQLGEFAKRWPHVIDMRSDYQQGLQQLIRVLRQIGVGRVPGLPPPPPSEMPPPVRPTRTAGGPFVPNFTYDIYISYAHVDNEPDSQDVRWVSRFQADLNIALTQRLGYGPAIYFDIKTLQPHHGLDNLLQSLRASALFIAVLSPSYVKLEWTLKELQAFESTGDVRNRIMVVELLPVDQDAYPPAFRQLMRTRFWWRDEREEAIPLRSTPTSEDYHRRLQALAHTVGEQLRELRRQATSAPAPAKVTEGSPVVMLAQVTNDLYDERDQVFAFLTQYGMKVLPEGDYLQGGAAFAAAVETDLKQADLFVQLLGPYRSNRPPDLMLDGQPTSYAQFQYAAAVRRGIRVLQWRRPDLDVASLNHWDKSLFDGPHVHAMGLQEFMREIRRAIDHKAAAAAAPRKGRPIFIVADTVDRDFATALASALAAKDQIVVLPAYKGPAREIEDYFEANFVDCDYIILLYGKASAAWVRAQLRRFTKLERLRAAPPRRKLIITASPGPKPDIAGAGDFSRMDWEEGTPTELAEKILKDLSL